LLGNNHSHHIRAGTAILTSRDDQGNYLFNANSSGRLFLSALRKLSERSKFIDSRNKLLQVAPDCFPDASECEKVKDAVDRAFDAVGIQ
jgi:Zn-dependent metalloprotease